MACLDANTQHRVFWKSIKEFVMSGLNLDLIPAEHLAKAMHIPLRRLRQMLRDLPEPVKIGRRLFWHRADIEKFFGVGGE